MIRVLGEDLLGQAPGFLTEKEIYRARGLEIGFVISSYGFFTKKPMNTFRVFFKKNVKVRVRIDIQQMPIIQPGTLEVFIFKGESQGFDKVQRTAQCGTGSGNAAGILRDLGFHQNHPGTPLVLRIFRYRVHDKSYLQRVLKSTVTLTSVFTIA